MAHLIDMSNSRANMAYVGETPWHGLGQELTAGASMEVWKQASGLSFAVLRAMVQFHGVNGLTDMPGRDVLYRSDTGAPLGCVSDGYKIVQPGEVLEFFADLCADRGFAMETAGSLKGGALYWALARTGHSADLTGKGDTCNGYVLLSSSADGTRATDARFTSVRVVCNNTLSIAMARNTGASAKTRHSTQFSAEATKKTLGLVDFDTAWNSFRAQMRQLCDIRVSADQATEYFSDLLRPAGERAKPRAAIGAQSFEELLGVPFGGSYQKTATDKAPVDRAIRGLADLEECYYKAPGAVPGTAYGLVQGVTRFIDHVRGKDSDKRLTSAWFGQGDTLKQTAVEKALALA